MKQYSIQWLTSISVIILHEFVCTDREILRKQTVVTSPDNLDELYCQVKSSLRFTYVDDGQPGYLRYEDYSGSITPDKYKRSTIPSWHQLSSSIVTQKEQDFEHKSTICAHIFNSTFFQAFHNEQAVDFSQQESQTRGDLELNNPYMFNAIYTGVRWLNPYTKRDVLTINRRLKEHTFGCVSRKLGTRDYKGYFISPIYQSPEVISTINGRFIFVTNEQNELKLFARAEEPAQVDGTVIELTHRTYYSARRNESSSSSSEPDAERQKICVLPIAEKVRVCALIFGAGEFENGFKFLPIEQHVEAECQRKNVIGRIHSFKEYHFQRRMNITIAYYEWMIGCKVMPANSNGDATSTYYVSQGWPKYTAIIFEPHEFGRLTPIFGLSGLGPLSGPGVIKPISVVRTEPIMLSATSI